ncbi:membrane integrity-associated transporter subunit PqiC [Belnapia sp. T6]|uniref:Membrane integrity-associated transporter subunit PqiC n=1 Tax=Belnapia mucosa TaxID=2804532 RepID=A0ABS1VAQ1_9PROT|nr:ABC-type transport auxiliary lipoprotein family protein [Belnapia mucosa]MBL6458746.1 membrane integrity-associated transporter subunit PqiC [Belnapia mucosa]
MIRRRAVLLTPLLAGCSVLPERPYRETQRFALAPERPQRAQPPRGAPVLLIRSLRAAPGLEGRGLRSLGTDGRITTTYWQEWAAPPAELVEEALRRWLIASGRFAAVTQPGSRLRADLVLEAELIRLEASPAAGQGRAALSVLLLAEPGSGPGEARILGQFVADGVAPLPGDAPPEAAASAMAAALAAALADLEARLVRILPVRREGPVSRLAPAGRPPR